jgi:hypothetical protein
MSTKSWLRLGRCAIVMSMGGFVLSGCSSGQKSGDKATTPTSASTPGATGTTSGPGASGQVTTTTQGPISHPVMTKVQATRFYVSAAKPANAALKTLVSEAGTWTASTTVAQAEAEAKPVIDAVIAFEPKLSTLAFSYPAAKADLVAEVDASGTIQSDIASLSTVNFQNAAAWTQKFLSDVATLNAANNAVRKELGRPPADLG